VATQGIGLPEHDRNAVRGSILTWIATIPACVYCLWIGSSLYYTTGKFAELFNSFGGQLPTSTFLVVENYRWYYPLLFGGATVVLIAKQFFVRRKWISLAITLGAVITVGVITNEIAKALYRPVIDQGKPLK
jgi:type II secretory pathway component PulF